MSRHHIYHRTVINELPVLTGNNACTSIIAFEAHRPKHFITEDITLVDRQSYVFDLYARTESRRREYYITDPMFTELQRQTNQWCELLINALNYGAFTLRIFLNAITTKDLSTKQRKIMFHENVILARTKDTKEDADQLFKNLADQFRKRGLFSGKTYRLSPDGDVLSNYFQRYV